MSGLVDKVREKVRGRSRSRSRSRKSLSQDYSNVPPVPQSPIEARNEEVRRSHNFDQDTSQRMSSPTTPAWHVHKGVRNSMDAQTSSNAPPSQLESGYNVGQNLASSHQPSYAQHHPQNPASESVPARFSSLQAQPQRDLLTSEVQSRNTVPYPYTVPRRKDSLPQNRHSRKISPDQRKGEPQRSVDLPRSSQQTYESAQRPATTGNHRDASPLPPVQSTSNDLGTEIDQALANLSVNERSQQPPMEHSGEVAPETMENLRLPAEFKLGHSTKTSIDTKWRAAVTHEDIRHERTEIVREAITREVHIHHYYTYIQPIKVVEVLPAKHYRFDEKTGVRVEIPPPPGWEMPAHLQPRSPDTSDVRGWSRHYLVNDQYPTGVLEAAPQNPSQNGHYSSKQLYRNGY